MHQGWQSPLPSALRPPLAPRFIMSRTHCSMVALLVLIVIGRKVQYRTTAPKGIASSNDPASLVDSSSMYLKNICTDVTQYTCAVSIAHT